MLLDNKYADRLANLKFIDLFAGIGGFRLAFESFGAKCVFSSEWNKQACEVYKSNFGDKPKGDITKINEEDIPTHDILCAGFPCQPFSVSGLQKGFNDTRGTLFFDIERIVSHHKPKVLLLENVKNFKTHDGGRTLETVCNSLTKLGYKVFYSVLSASSFGVPQMRERIYFVCFHESLGINEFNFPEPIKEFQVLNDILEDNIPNIDRDDIQISRSDDIERTPMAVRIGKINTGRQGERIYHPNGHAITLSAHGGGIGAKTGLYKIGNGIRRLTPRECARVTGFPDSFKLHNSSSQAYQQFGNSVVVDVLQHIIMNIIVKLEEGSHL